MPGCQRVVCGSVGMFTAAKGDTSCWYHIKLEDEEHGRGRKRVQGTLSGDSNCCLKEVTHVEKCIRQPSEQRANLPKYVNSKTEATNANKIVQATYMHVTHSVTYQTPK